VDVETVLNVAGTAPESETVSVSLEAAGVVLADTSVGPGPNGHWSASLEVPANVTGDVLVRVAAAGQTVEQRIQVMRPNAAPPFITLVYPTNEGPAVSGRALIYQGRVQRPPGGTVTIALLVDDCQETAAEQSFDVGAGGRYWGYLVIPQAVSGPACAVASFGEPGVEPWQAVNILTNVVPADDPQARGLFLGNFPESDVPRGEPVTVYGSAYNPPNRQVQVSLEVNGRAVAEGTAIADSFGYWEIELTLPTSVPAGSAGQFVALVGYPGEPETMSVPFFAVTP
jgi:hypothetical protein